MISTILNMIGIPVLSTLSTLLFIIFFVVMLIWVFKLDRSYIKSVSEMPIRDSDFCSPDDKDD